jgi:hypothetical protein
MAAIMHSILIHGQHELDVDFLSHSQYFTWEKQQTPQSDSSDKYYKLCSGAYWKQG